MSHEIDNPMSEGLVHQAAMPFCFGPRSSEPSELVVLEEKNERLLQALSTLDEHYHESTEDDREWVGEIARLEAKIDLLLAMVAKMSASEDSLELRAISLTAKGLAWRDRVTDCPVVGDLIWIQIKPDDRLLEPLRLPAEIYSTVVDNGSVNCSARFVGQGEQVLDLLEKLIFKFHRRAVAHLRTQQKSNAR